MCMKAFGKGELLVPKQHRDTWIDIVKGLAIILVILGHIDIPIWL